MNQPRINAIRSFQIGQLTCGKSTICNKPIRRFPLIWLLHRLDLRINKLLNKFKITNLTNHLVRGYKAPTCRSRDSRGKTEPARPTSWMKMGVASWWIRSLWFQITFTQLIKYWVIKIRSRPAFGIRKWCHRCLWPKRSRPILARNKPCWIWIWAKCWSRNWFKIGHQKQTYVLLDQALI